MDKVLIEIRDMHKIYNPGENEVRALDGVDLTIYENEFVAIIGHSVWMYRLVVLTGFMTLMYRIWRMMSFLMCATVKLDLFFRGSI